jgi:hemolysin activation/secretion protein
MITRVIIYYRNHDRPIVDVFVPEQDITIGTVQVVILEGYVGKITTTGNHWFSDHEISSNIRLQPGDPIRSSELRADLDWLNANPFRSTDAIYHPGVQLGATDIELRTQERFPLRLYAGYDNDGNPVTGLSREEAGFNWGNAFALGQQFNFQYTTSGEDLRAESASYVIPLPWRNTLTFFGSYTETHGAIPPYLGISGRSYQISGRYSVPLPEFGSGPLKYKHNVAAGFDYKYNDNALEFGGLSAGGTLYDVAQFVLSYNGALSDPHGRTTLDFEGYFSPGNWVGNNNDAAFNAAHTLAGSQYTYGTLMLERLNRLPGDWSVVLRGTLQLSDSNLAPSEQLGFGGYDTVRGYSERTTNADEGTITTVEVRTPDLGIGQPLDKAEWQLLAFWDQGTAFNHSLLTNEQRETRLSSVGMGLRASVSTYMTLRLDWGLRLLAAGSDSRDGSRCDVSLVASY